LEVSRKAGHQTALEVRDAIVMAVDKHMEHEAPEDDLTIVVLKWLDHHPSSTDRHHKGSAS
jgi:serine phosphatase RsbU (regulator of sigma subunit)